MVETIHTRCVTDSAGFEVTFEEQASTFNPHALPQALAAVTTAGISPRIIVSTAPDVTGSLIGVWALSAKRTFPFLKSLKAPLMPLYDVSGAPMILRGHEIPILKSMVQTIKRTAPSRVMVIKNLQAEGAVWGALNHIAATGEISLTVVETWERAVLDRTVAKDAESYLALALSGSNRKRLRSKRQIGRASCRERVLMPV